MTGLRSPRLGRGPRVILAMTILILVLAWRSWPHSDQRFVGTWRSGSSFSILEADGFTSCFDATADDHGCVAINYRVRWWVRNGMFEVLRDDGSFKSWMLNNYDRWLKGEQAIEGQTWFGAEIIELTDQTFVLQEGKRIYRFHRVAD